MIRIRSRLVGVSAGLALALGAVSSVLAGPPVVGGSTTTCEQGICTTLVVTPTGGPPASSTPFVAQIYNAAGANNTIVKLSTGQVFYGLP